MTTFANPSSEGLRSLLEKTETIAIVGLSPKRHRPSHHIARALQGFGYRIVPVNPGIDEVLGERAYARLTDISDRLDLVNVFRAPQYVAGVVEDCLAARVDALWMQDGVVDAESALKAARAGITVVMNRCIYRDYLSLLG